jgi:SAM-dependent methyltransferase
MTPSPAAQADYGIDAPKVVRNLFLAGACGLGVWALNSSGLWSGVLALPMPSEKVYFVLGPPGLSLGIGCSLMGAWMLWSGKVGKVRERERLLDRLTWKGNERVLDVGCGRGLLLVGAARRLTTGKAIGIDIWQAEDLSGNSLDATTENARREGVADRVEVQTADMRELPFADSVFDVVLSRAAIHNLYSAGDRAKAILQIARVLKPGGYALIDDIRHGREYARNFSEHGCTDIRRLGSGFASALWALVSFGALRPATLLVRRSA